MDNSQLSSLMTITPQKNGKGRAGVYIWNIMKLKSSHHISTFLHSGSNSQLTSVITKDKKNTPRDDPRTKELCSKDSWSQCSLSDSLPHSVLPVTASERFTNGGIAKTLDFAKQANSNQSISY